MRDGGEMWKSIIRKEIEDRRIRGIKFVKMLHSVGLKQNSVMNRVGDSKEPREISGGERLWGGKAGGCCVPCIIPLHPGS